MTKDRKQQYHGMTETHSNFLSLPRYQETQESEPLAKVEPDGQAEIGSIQ